MKRLKENTHKVRAGWTTLGQAIGHKPFRAVCLLDHTETDDEAAQTAHRAVRHTHTRQDAKKTPPRQ